MARSTNMVIPEVVHFDGVRVFQEKIDVFNEASGGAITLSYDPGYLDAMGGDYEKPVRFARPSGLDAHQDEADPTTADTPATFAQAKGAEVLQTRRAYGKWTRDEVTRGIANGADWTTAITGFIADYKLEALRNNLLASGVAAIDSMDTPSANYHVVDGTLGKVTGAKVKFTFARMSTLLNKMGDARQNIKTLVFHSSVLADLITDGLANYVVDTVAGAMIIKDAPFAMGRRIMVIDSSKLYTELDSDYYTQYNVLGLAEGALNATIVKEDAPIEKVETDKKVTYWTLRQDYDVKFSVQGMKWVVGTINPTDAELATAASWDEDLSDHRECGIVKGIYNAT